VSLLEVFENVSLHLRDLVALPSLTLPTHGEPCVYINRRRSILNRPYRRFHTALKQRCCSSCSGTAWWRFSVWRYSAAEHCCLTTRKDLPPTVWYCPVRSHHVALQLLFFLTSCSFRCVFITPTPARSAGRKPVFVFVSNSLHDILETSY